jgi:hypothetical protein
VGQLLYWTGEDRTATTGAHGEHIDAKIIEHFSPCGSSRYQINAVDAYAVEAQAFVKKMDNFKSVSVFPHRELDITALLS